MLDSQLIFMIFRVVPRLPEDGGGGGGGGWWWGGGQLVQSSLVPWP